jgi:biotin carboxyl carrier protein
MIFAGNIVLGKMKINEIFFRRIFKMAAIESPMAGKVLEILVEVGTKVLPKMMK